MQGPDVRPGRGPNRYPPSDAFDQAGIKGRGGQ